MSGGFNSRLRRTDGSAAVSADDLVLALRTLRRDPVPRASFRADLRAQLVAIAPTLVAEGVGTLTTELRGTPHRRTAADLLGPALSGLSRKRVVRGASALVAVCAVMLGVALWLSSRALPGDALYGLKRAEENVQLDFTHGTARGREYLSLAHIRASEASRLAGSNDAAAVAAAPGVAQAGGLSKHVTKLIDSTMDSADTDLTHAWNILLTQSAQDNSDKPLQYMIAWVPSQVKLLTSTAARLPAGEARSRVLASIAKAKVAQHLAVETAPQARNGTLGTQTTTPGHSNSVPGSGGASTPGSGETKPAGSSSSPGGSRPSATSDGSDGSGGSGHSGGTNHRGPGLPKVPLPTITLPGGLPTITLPTLGGDGDDPSLSGLSPSAAANLPSGAVAVDGTEN